MNYREERADFLERKAVLIRSIDFMRAFISRSLLSLISRKRCCSRFLRIAGVSFGLGRRDFFFIVILWGATALIRQHPYLCSYSHKNRWSQYNSHKRSSPALCSRSTSVPPQSWEMPHRPLQSSRNGYQLISSTPRWLGLPLLRVWLAVGLLLIVDRHGGIPPPLFQVDTCP